MTNLLIIVAAKIVLTGVLALVLRPAERAPGHALARAVAVGSVFGLAFFGLFYALVPAIAYEVPVTPAFIAVNAVLSYGATAATVALLPLGLPHRADPGPAWRERLYFTTSILAGLAAIALSANSFLRAFAIGAIVMSLAEVAALAAGRAGPVARMLHGAFGPLGAILAASAGLGVVYETANLLFPVWIWVSLDTLPAALRSGLMMAIGYIVLIHPLHIAVRLAAPQRGPSRGAAGGAHRDS